MKTKRTYAGKALLALLLCVVTLLLTACPNVPPPNTCTHIYENGVCTLCGYAEPPCTHTYENGVCTKCGAPDPSQVGDDDVVYGDGAPIEGAGDSLAENAPIFTPVTYDESTAVSSPGAIFFRSLKGDGKVYRATGDRPAALSDGTNKTYGGNNTVVLFDAGMKINGGSDITFRDMVIVGDIEIAGASRVTFENVQITGSVTVDNASTEVLFLDCRLSGEHPLTLAGKDHAVLRSYITFTNGGLTDKASGTVVKNCRFEGEGAAIFSSAVGASYTYNTLRGTGEAGILRMAKAENSLAAMNIVLGGQQSIALSESKNVSVARNQMISVAAEGNHAIYIVDNEMGGYLYAKDNAYILADGNAYPSDGKPHAAKTESNTYPSGDTLLDVDARLDAGADPALLPQVDRDLFTGMERRETVREAEGEERSLSKYVMEEAKNGSVVLLTPGAYSVAATIDLNAAHSDTTIYAYGVYAEGRTGNGGNYTNSHIVFTGAKRVAVKGMILASATQSCGQVYVLKKNGGAFLQVVAAAGMENEFCDSDGRLMNITSIGIQRAGTFYAIGDFSIVPNGITKRADGTMILTVSGSVYDLVEEGDILTCKMASGATCVRVTNGSSDILLKDMTIYGSASGFATTETWTDGPTTYYRVYNTTRLGELIDQATYERYEALEAEYGVDLEISIDEQKRYRGAPFHIGSADATHTTRCAVGSQVISCLFENMCDDGTNQNAMHARLSEVIDNGDGTTTLVYKGNLSEFNYGSYGDRVSYSGFCARFRKGDRVYVYTSAGQLVCDSFALDADEDYGTIPSTFEGVPPRQIQRYAVKVKTEDVNPDALAGFDLADDDFRETHKVLVDNMSRSSNGFFFDNTMVQNVRSRGLLIKSSDGRIQNCTFRNIAKVAVAVIYEIFWGESGVSEDVVIEKNLIDNTSFSPSGSLYKHVPIVIMGMGGKSVEADFLPYKRIDIVGNKYINRNISWSPYAIYIQAACDLRILNNDFGGFDGENEDDYCKVLLLSGVVNVELSGNTYPVFIEGDIEKYVEGEHYKNIYGDDVGTYVTDKP